ncbi:hypothetical protein DRH14_01535 [Candidatus Shapirobacteria bacterium]|nr:MAG: hypothetical protein DRH14_01535 [Candidatus Shapirobacteria bacterium]
MTTKKSLIFNITALLLIAILFISTSSLSEANSISQNPFFFLKKQAWLTLISLAVFFLATKIKLKHLYHYSPTLFLLSTISLLLVLHPQLSHEILGAKRWLKLGYFSFQPSEIFKLIAILYFARLFSQDKNKTIASLLFSATIPLSLILLEPNLSTVILLSTIILSLYYLSGANIIHLFLLCLFGGLITALLIFSSPYRLARLNTLLHPQQNLKTQSYHSQQNLIAIASGGLFGKGIGNSQQKYSFLPQISTDSILAIIGEEVGFMGLAIILFIYLKLLASIFDISKHSSTPFHRLLSAGIALWIGLQTIINISAISAIIPLTGIPLPLVSYGGSSLISTMFGLGLVYNIHNQHGQKK